MTLTHKFILGSLAVGAAAPESVVEALTKTRSPSRV